MKRNSSEKFPKIRRVTFIVESLDVVLVSLLLTLYIFHTFSRVSVADFVQINISWELLSPSSFTGILSYFLSISVSEYFLVPNFG